MPPPPTCPPGGTFFDTLKRNFADVPVDAAKDNAIATSEFLEAAESLTTLFDVLGSVAFTPVKTDMLGNIKKIRDRQLAAPAESHDLQSLVLNELKTKKHTATEGLLWLVRGLDFTAQALRHNVAKPAEELSASFRAAYATTLKPHHSFLVKPVFSAAMSATPYRRDFYTKLGGGGGGGADASAAAAAGTNAGAAAGVSAGVGAGVGADAAADVVVQRELRRWLEALEERVSILKAFQARKETQW